MIIVTLPGGRQVRIHNGTVSDLPFWRQFGVCRFVNNSDEKLVAVVRRSMSDE